MNALQEQNETAMRERQLDSRFLVYAHLIPATDEIMYVGSGGRKRPFDDSRNRLWWKIVYEECNGEFPKVHILEETETEEAALALETQAIKRWMPRANIKDNPVNKKLIDAEQIWAHPSRRSVRPAIVKQVAESLPSDVVAYILNSAEKLMSATRSEKTKEGMERARQAGKVLGRPLKPCDRDRVAELRAAGASLREIALEVGLSKSSVARMA